MNINRYKNGFRSPFWISYIHSLLPSDSLDLFTMVFSTKRFRAVDEGFGENLDHHGGSVLPSRTPEPALFLTLPMESSGVMQVFCT